MARCSSHSPTGGAAGASPCIVMGVAELEPDTEGADRGRFSRWALPDGTEPDPRFTLANERTFLAWVRTSLAFLAGGVAIEAFPIADTNPNLRLWLAVTTISCGLLIACGAALRWWRVEMAMRRHRPLPVPGIIPLLSLVAAVAALSAVLLLL